MAEEVQNKKEFSAQQEAFLQYLQKDDEAGTLGDSYKAAFTFVNMQPEEFKRDAWAVSQKLNKGVSFKDFSKFEAEYNERSAGGNYEHFPAMDPQFFDDSWEEPQVPEGLFPTYEEKLDFSEKHGYMPMGSDVVSGRWGPMVAAAITETIEDIGTSTQAVIPTIIEEGVDPFQLQLNRQEYETAVAKLNSLMEHGIDDVDILQASLIHIDQTRTKEDLYLAEKKYVDSILKFQNNNPDWKDVALFSPSLVDKLAKEAKNDAIIQSWIERKQTSERKSNTFFEFVDDAFEFLQQVLTLSDVIGGLRQHGLDAHRLQYLAQEIRGLDPELVPTAMEAYWTILADKSAHIGVDQEETFRKLSSAFGDNKDIEDVQTSLMVDAAFSVPFVGVFKAGKGVTKGIMKMGGSKAITDDAVRALENTSGTVYARAEDAVEDILGVPSIAGAPTPVLSEAVDRSLRVTKNALDEVARSPGVHRLSQEELNDAVQRKVKQIEATYSREEISHTGGMWDPKNGVYKFETYLGKRDNNGFATESTARGYMTKHNIEGEVVQLDNGFYIKQQFTVGENLADGGLKLSIPTIGGIRRFLQSPKAFVDRHLGSLGTGASYHEALTADTVKKVFRSAFGKLSSKEINELGDILNGLIKADTRKWHTPDELAIEARQRFGKELSEEQVTAYYTYKQISDFSYWLDNNRMYKEAAAKGLDSVELTFTNVGKFNGKVASTSDGIKHLKGEHRVYNAATNTVEKLDSEEMRKLIDKGYLLVKPDDAAWTIKEFGGLADYIITKSRKSVKVNPLDKVQLNYVAGGRRTYNTPFFVGQRVIGALEDGTKYVMAPSIFRTARTHKEAQKWANEANEFLATHRKVLSGELTEEEAARLLSNKSAHSYNDWKRMADEEGWKTDTDFRIKKDRQDFEMNRGDEDIAAMMKLYNPEDSTQTFFARKGNRLGGRGDWIPDVDGTLDNVHDYLGTLNRNTNQAVNAGVYSDFKISAINRFNTSYRGYLDNPNMSPYEAAVKGKVADWVSDEVRNEILAHQAYIKSILRQRGWWDEKVHKFMDDLATWIEDGKGGRRDKISTAIHRDGANPMEKVRAINFDLNLGMYNPRQFFTQLNSAVVSMAISPKYGLAAAKDAIPLRYALIADDVATSDWINNAVKGLNEGSDIAKAAEQFKRMGFNSYGSNLAMMDAQSSLGATSNRLVSKGKRFVEHGRIVFQEGERGSRMVAYGIARRKYAERFPTKDSYGRQADSWIREEADRILLSPNSDNNALIHKGIGSIPTQFWSYMIKLSDAMFTGSGGRYTGAERARIAGAQLLFYGAAGMPMLDYMLDQAERSSDVPLDPNLAKFLHNGIVDLIPFIASGGELDTNFAGANGIGGFWNQTITDLADSPISQIMGGATGRNLSGGWRSMVETARVYGLMREPSMEAVTQTALAGIVSLTKSLTAFNQTIVAYNTGIWHDKYGRALAEVTQGEAIAGLLGAYPQKADNAWKIVKMRSENKKKYVDDVVPAYTTLYLKYFNAKTDAEKEHIEGMINAFGVVIDISGYGRDVYREVMTRVGRDPNIHKAQQNMLFFDLQKGRDVNPNLLTPEQKQFLREQKINGK